MTDKKCYTQLHKDISYPNKVRGYIVMQPTRFNLLALTSLLLTLRIVDQYLKLAKTIRESGVPNYWQVGVPIKSGLNIETWRRQLHDYKDQVLLQYLEYGFPLSIKDSRSLTEQNTKNHFLATQYHQAVSSYLAKERQFGAIMGPIPKVQDYAIHCSPLITRPKHTDKRHVINME